MERFTFSGSLIRTKIWWSGLKMTRYGENFGSFRMTEVEHRKYWNQEIFSLASLAHAVTRWCQPVPYTIICGISDYIVVLGQQQVDAMRSVVVDKSTDDRLMTNWPVVHHVRLVIRVTHDQIAVFWLSSTKRIACFDLACRICLRILSEYPWLMSWIISNW